MDTITIGSSGPTTAGLPKDYFSYHYTFNKSLYSALKVKNTGIDVIFLYQQPNIKSFCKKIDRFWHNFRKTKTKYEYNEIRCRTMLWMIPSIEAANQIIKHLEEGKQWINK